MWSFVALKQILRKRLLRIRPLPLETVAVKQWVIAEGETTISPPAYYLPNQLERVTGWGLAPEDPRGEMPGGRNVSHAATRGFLLRDAVLLDGTLYHGNACSYLQPRSSRRPWLRVNREIQRAAVYCTPGGNEYFGQWLIDDCVSYPLAAAEGVPVTTNQPVSVHTPGYEDWLGMAPERLDRVFFREVVVFQDFGQNRNKHQRFRAMSERLLSRVAAQTHPGVFILRGKSGARRFLRNEMELAERLRDRRGFRILDPTQADVPTIVATCAGAKVVVGVEGSGLAHGLLVLPPGGALVTLQPPNRFVTFYKHLTDRDGQHFGFVVGIAEGDDFRIDATELERTLDLLPKG